MPEKTEPKTLPVPIRFERGTIRRLDRAAKRIGANRSTIARLGILQLLDQMDAGSIKVPRDADSAA